MGLYRLIDLFSRLARGNAIVVPDGHQKNNICVDIKSTHNTID